MKIARWGLMILLASPAGFAAAQAQQDQAPAQQPQQSQPAEQKPDPLAEAARKAREQKKDQPKATKVWDNDSMPDVAGTINVVGQEAPATDNSTAAAPAANQNNGAPAAAGAAGTPASPTAGGATKDQLTAELNAAKEQLESLQKDLDLQQRQFTLDQQMWLSKPDHDGDREGAASLKTQQDVIAQKQQQVADAQKKVDELQSKVNAAGDVAAKPPAQ